MRKVIVSGLLAFVALSGARACAETAPESRGKLPISKNEKGHENIEWSVSYAFHFTDANKDLPRVLLVGDSICGAYQDRVTKTLEGRVNMTYWVSSYSISAKNYMKFLDIYLTETKYEVIHFNNGLHSLGASKDTWGKRLREVFNLIRKRQPQAKVIWCSSTPLKDPSLTEKARGLNEIAAKLAKEFGFTVNDLFARLDPLDRNENWRDVYHHKGELVVQEAKWVSDAVLDALKQAEEK